MQISNFEVHLLGEGGHLLMFSARQAWWHSSLMPASAAPETPTQTLAENVSVQLCTPHDGAFLRAVSVGEAVVSSRDFFFKVWTPVVGEVGSPPWGIPQRPCGPPEAGFWPFLAVSGSKLHFF